MLHSCMKSIDKYDSFSIVVTLPEPGGKVLTVQTSWWGWLKQNRTFFRLSCHRTPQLLCKTHLTKHLKLQHTGRFSHSLLIGSFIPAYGAKKPPKKQQRLSKVDEQSFVACLTRAVWIGTDTDINGERLKRLQTVYANRPSRLQAKHLLSQLTTSAID